MKHIHDIVHEILRNLHRITISSSVFLKMAEKHDYVNAPSEENMKKALKTIEKSCTLAQTVAGDVDKLREEVYGKLDGDNQNRGEDV